MSSRLLVATVAAAAAAATLASAAAAGASSSSPSAPLSYPPAPATCSGTINNLPIWTGEPTLVNTTTNGIKSTAAPANYSAPLLVLHVYGTDYEMGLAYGQLLTTEINTLIPRVNEYLYEQMNASLDWIAEPYRDLVMEYGLEFALNATYAMTAPYTPPYWSQLMQGIADGASLDFMSIARLCMIPEFIKAQCSILGAWGQATTNGSLVQLRALDFDTDGPFQEFPVLATFHPSNGNGFTHTTMSWAGLIGAITGFSSSGLAISEKVWDAYNGYLNSFGVPFHFLLQDILRFDLDTDAALSRIATANRTCAIWIGLGDKFNDQFKIVGYSNQLVQIWNPRNFIPYPNHDSFADLIFVNKHVQPSSEPCMNDAIHAIYGSIEATTLFQYVTALEQTGDCHIAVYDFANSLMYVSNASPGDGHGNGVIPAYDRPFLRFNMTEQWGMPAPPAASVLASVVASA